MTSEQQLPEPKTQEDFIQLEALDEEQILDELKGHVLTKYFYEFEVLDKESNTKRRVVGISFAGVKAVSSHMAVRGHPIDVSHVDINETDTMIRAICHGVDKATGEGWLGVSEQAKMFPGGKPNVFAFTIAVSKAQRNTKRHFMPEKVIEECYLEWKQLKEQGKAPPSLPPSNPPAPSTAKKAATLDEITYLVREFPVECLEKEGVIVVDLTQSLEKSKFDSLKAILAPYSARLTYESGHTYFKI